MLTSLQQGYSQFQADYTVSELTPHQFVLYLFNMSLALKQSKQRRPKWIAPDLPQYYYHTNFCDLLTFVEDRYGHCFDESHESLFSDFRELPFSAQALYVRLAGRKGQVFDRHKLRYDDIDDQDLALRNLIEAGFVSAPRPVDLHDCLNTLTKPELIVLMRSHLRGGSFKFSSKKSVLIAQALEELPSEVISTLDNLIVQGRSDELAFISFLYFGKADNRLQQFTLRDLGVLRTPDFKADYSARFDTYEEAHAAWFYVKSLHDFKHGSANDVAKLIDTVPLWPLSVCDHSTNARDKLLQKLGGLSEQCGDADTAIELYGQSTAPLCNERTIRLRYTRNSGSHKDRDWVKDRLESLIDNPGSDEEYYFASDFYARKFGGKRTGLMTDLLWDAQTVEIDEILKTEPERAVKTYFYRMGAQAYRTENTLWKTLFGLLFWDELYGKAAKGLHNGFERLPSTLKSGKFYDECECEIEAKLKLLSSTDQLHIQLLKTISRYHGTPNGIFRWSTNLDKIHILTEHAPDIAIAGILRRMAQDYKSMKDGFPDLMVLENEEVRFYEVKAEGDVVRRNQLTRLMQLRDSGFDADIVRVNWCVDPNQTYVVVDVETTGGRPGLHRLTEIGAVKTQNGKVIDEWQSLLNPKRSIPPAITRLTGISQEMVKDAPRFADIADDFRTFMGDAIFVAHNVNFDYGFIKSEYQNLGETFRHPKLCTVASMRKFYPGLKSYSLNNLCSEFGIDLSSHHRAMCDAKAASELLHLVNDKRLDT